MWQVGKYVAYVVYQDDKAITFEPLSNTYTGVWADEQHNVRDLREARHYAVQRAKDLNKGEA
jgi:hypothetical protein